jgi:acyl-CoA thioesterase
MTPSTPQNTISTPPPASLASSPWGWTRTDQSSSSLILEGRLGREWYQGRGVYGGIIAALFMEAMIPLAASRPPRTLTLHFCAPAVEGKGRISVRLESKRKSVSHLRATLEGESGLIATASATFALPRTCQWTHLAAPPPSMPDRETVPEVPLGFPLMPDYCQFLSYRFCLGDPPYSQSDSPLVGGWFDFRQKYPLNFSLIAALLDAWPPACFPSLKAPIPAASVDLTYHFLTTDLSTLQRPFIYKGSVQSASDGYAEERDFLWDAQGTPIASARQWVALGKAIT